LYVSIFDCFGEMRTGDNLTTDSEPLNRRKPGVFVEALWSDLAEKGETSEPKDSEYIPYVMHDHNIYDYIVFVPRALVHNLRNMARQFGWEYLLSIFIVYGFQQGIGNAWFFQVGLLFEF
jgi:hypothetical protein